VAVFSRKILLGPFLERTKLVSFEDTVKTHLRRLAREGCRVAGYSLSGAEPWPKLCSKHIVENWRVVVAFHV
jgi:hypothetical protein